MNGNDVDNDTDNTNNLYDLAKLLYEDHQVRKIALDLRVKDDDNNDVEPIANDIFELLINMFCIGICKFDEEFNVFQLSDDTVVGIDEIRYIQNRLQQYLSKINVRLHMDIVHDTPEVDIESAISAWTGEYCVIQCIKNTIEITKLTHDTYQKLEDMYAYYKVQNGMIIRISFSFMI